MHTASPRCKAHRWVDNDNQSVMIHSGSNDSKDNECPGVSLSLKPPKSQGQFALFPHGGKRGKGVRLEKAVGVGGVEAYLACVRETLLIEWIELDKVHNDLLGDDSDVGRGLGSQSCTQGDREPEPA